MWTMNALDGRGTGLFDLRLTVPAKAVWARLAGAAVAISSLGLVVALLPGAATARLAASTAGTGPTVPVVACASSYGAAPPTGLPVFPHTIRPGLPAHVAKMLAYYTNNQRTLAPVLGPRGWDCQVQVGADGTTGLDIYPPGKSPAPVGTGHPEVQATSDSLCQGCVYTTVCSLVPGAGQQLGFAMLPCHPRPKGEVIKWLSGSAQHNQAPVRDVIGFEVPGQGPTNGVVLYDYLSGQGGMASQETCTLPAGQRPVCTAVLNDFVKQRWLMS
jgi:hypothetical protein